MYIVKVYEGYRPGWLRWLYRLVIGRRSRGPSDALACLATAWSPMNERPRLNISRISDDLLHLPAHALALDPVRVG
jgi:hypothetical protein